MISSLQAASDRETLRAYVGTQSNMTGMPITIRPRMNKASFFLTLVFASMIFALVNPKAPLANDCTRGWRSGSMPCLVDTISTFEISFQGDHLRNRLEEYKRLIRLRVRNDLSMMRIEDREPFPLFEEFGYNGENHELRRRATLHCNIWTLGNSEFPVVYRIKCEIIGFGVYETSLNQSISHEMLGFGPRRDLNTQISEALRSAVSTVAASFLEARGTTSQPTPQPRASDNPAPPAAPQRATNPPRRL
jgi:hypothetical protein